MCVCVCVCVCVCGLQTDVLKCLLHSLDASLAHMLTDSEMMRDVYVVR